MDAEVPLPITPDMLLSRRVDFERRMRRTPPVTLAIIVLLVVVFLGEPELDGSEGTGAVVGMGALVRERVLAGEWWRLVSATLLHGGLEHLAGNAIGLFILGMVCEHAFGRRQFLLLYAASGVGGSLVSLLLGPGPSVGASGAIFGLQGAAIALFYRHRARLLLRDRRIGLVLLAWGIYTIGGGLASPFIDNGAHIGGLLTGLLLGGRLHPVILEPMPPEHAARVRLVVWLLGLVLAYVAVGWITAP